MKKLIVLALILLTVIASIFGYYLYSQSKPVITDTGLDVTLQTQILNNSSWITLTKEDFYGYLNGTYTESVQKIITSLEEAIPVIFQTSNDKFGEFENYTFMVASAFDSSNNVYIYYYNPEKNSYIKTLNQT